VADTTQEFIGIEGTDEAPGWSRKLLRRTLHLLAYHFVLKRRRSTVSRAAGFSLIVRPTVFHPRIFLAGEYFANVIARLDIAGLDVVDVGTGSGILALAAARAGAASVVALDINPIAARTAADNARSNGYGERVTALCSDLFAALAPHRRFDVILSNPPYFPGEPLDLADRAWHAGDDYRLIHSLFEQARARLKPGGRFYLLLSSDSDLHHLRILMQRARFRARLVDKCSFVIESLLIYELRAH
jgi:methylase of polypeptide subunit release factors